MYILFVSLLTTFFAPIGYGALFDKKNQFTVGEKGLLGLFISGAMALILHFFLALSNILSIVFVSIGICLFCYFVFSKHIHFQREVLITIFLVAVLVLFFSYYAVIPYDTGLYHMQTIIWNKSYALSFGLANFHGRFGFNSIWFLVAALLGFNESVYYVLNGILFLFIIISFAEFIFTKKGNGTGKIALYALMLLVAFLPSLSTLYVGVNYFASPSNDFPATLLIIYFAFLLMKKTEKKANYLAPFLAIFAVFVKMSTLPLGVMVIVLSVFKGKKIYMSFGIIVLFTLLWFMRGIILSGCMIYPLKQTCIPSLSWAVSTKQVVEEANITKSWARVPGASLTVGLSTTQWVKPWLLRTFHSDFIQFYLIVFTCIALLYGVVGITKRKIRREDIVVSSVPLLTALIGIIYWFLSAPDIRFGVGYFIVILLAVGYPLIYAFFPSPHEEIQTETSIFLIVMIVVFSFVLVENRNTFFWMLRYGGKVNLPIISPTELRRVKNNQDEIYYVPKNGDQCGNSEKLCTPNILKGVSWEMEGSRYFFKAQK